MNKFNDDSTSLEEKEQEPATKIKTGADLQDMMLDVLGGKTEEVTSSDTANVEDDKAQYHKNIAVTIADAQKQLDAIDESDLRGLPKDYLRRWEVGYLPNYQHQKLSGTRRTPRFIFKLGDDNDPPSINAVLTPRGREFFKNHRGNFGKASEKCLSEGNKLVFNPKALDEEITAVTEGEFDSVSIMFATDESVKVCALGGAGLFGDLKKRLASKKRRPKIVILFDKDEHTKTKSGQKGAADLLKELSEMCVVATVKYFDDFMTDDQKQIVGAKIDANEILQKCGKQVLNELTAKIIESARADFPAIEERIKQSINTQVTTDDKSRRENYSLEIEDLIREINTTITPADLEAHGYLRHSERGSARPDGYCCPWCGSGDGEHKTGALKYITNDGEPHFGCGKCGGGGNVITFLAHVKNLPTRGKEFFDTLKSVADEFNIPYNPKIFATQPPKRRTANLPIELVLPADVEFQGNTIVIISGTEDKPKIFTAARTLILPTKKFVSDGGGNLRYEVAIRSPRGKWTRADTDMRTLLEPSKIYELAAYGANIANAKLLASYFSKLLALTENDDVIPEVTVFNRPGWHDGKFIYPTPEDNESYRVERSGIDYASIFKSQGDKDAWLKTFWDIVHGKQGELKRIVIGACLLAPMLKVIKIPNPQFNLWGTSNYAKTPLPKFGLSIYGDPSEGAMLRTWNATAKNMLTMSAGFNGLPLMIDEGETMSRRTQAELSEYVYNFSIGVIGQANKRNGDVRATEKFRGVRFSTAERPLHDTADKRGAYKRLIDIHVTEPLFADAYARNLHIFCEGNFGHFGRQWTKYIEANQDKIRADFDRTQKFFAEDGFKRDGIRAEYNSVDATNARAVIGCAVAYWHFLMCLEIEDTFDFVEARHDAAAILAELPTVDEISDVKRSLELLASWVVENPRRFITPARVNGVEVDDRDYPADTHASTVGKKFADGRIAFFANAFRNVIAEIGLPSYEKVLCDLYDADLLDCKSSREKAKTINLDGQSARAYVLKAEALAASTNNDD